MNEMEDTTQATASQRSYEEIIATIRQQVIRQAAWVTAGVGLFAMLLGGYTAILSDSVFLVPVYVVIYAAVLFISFSDRTSPTLKAGVIIVVLYVLGVTDLVRFGWGGDGRLYLLAFPVMATVLLGKREGFWALGVGFVTLLIVALGLFQGFIPDPTPFAAGPRPWSSFMSNVVGYLLVGGFLVTSQQTLVSILVTKLEDILTQSMSLEEQQVALDRRATALQEANYAMQRRAWHLEAGAEVARVVTSIFDIEQLLYRSVRLISEKFGFYHTGLFIVEDHGEVAVLKAASSESGQQMLTAEHKLSRGEGMVGWVLEHGEPRVALDVGEDAVYFDNPWLPATHSEAALPLKIAGHIRGILDVQSTEENAFDSDDIRSLEFLAGQLAVALENARRLAQEGGALELTNPFYRMARQVAAARNVDDVWMVLLELINEYRPARAFIFETSAETIRLAAQLRIGEIMFPERQSEQDELTEKLHLHLLLKDLKTPLFVDDVQEVESLPSAHRTSLTRLHEDSAARGLAILPVRLGAHILAEIVVIFYTAHPFKIAEKQFYTALADTAAVVLENIRLLESTQRRVVRERTVRSITDRMRQAPDMKSLMRITAESLVETFGGEGAYIQLGPPESSDVLESPTSPASEEGVE